MDLLTPVGFVLGVAAVVVADLLDHGVLRSLINPSALLLVLGGTLGATLMSFRLADVRSVPRQVLASLRQGKQDRVQLVKQLVSYAELARREGLLRLDAELEGVQDPFLRHGLMMAVDGTDEELVRRVLEAEMDARQAPLHLAARFLETAGGFAPTLGIIGTVVGLVSVLSNISNAARLAPSIATAFIATLWGVSSANLFWLPLANKVKRTAQVLGDQYALALEGVLAIEAGDNPRIVADKLKAYLTPEEMDAFDKAREKEKAPAEASASPATPAGRATAP
jgi:chemotaxis protein MotA